MRTSAFASTAPLASCTVPEMAPVAPPCPKAGAASASAITARTTNLIEELAILFPPGPAFWTYVVLLRNRDWKASTARVRAGLGQDKYRVLPFRVPCKECFCHGR